MARPASATALVPVLTLLVGLAVGWATNPFGGDDAQPAAVVRVAAPSSSPDAARATGPTVPEEAAQHSGRTQAAGREPAAETPTEVAEVPPENPAPATLTAELSAILRSGRIEGALSADAARMLRYAVEAYIAVGAPREALALIERHPDVESGMLGRVGYALMRAEDNEGAAQAFLAQLRRAGPDAFDVDDLQRLAQVDPQAALEFLDARAASVDTFLEEQLRGQRAVLLARAGQAEASMALLRELSAAGELDPQTLEALSFLPPEESEAFLRESLAADVNGSSTVALAELLGRTQRGEEGARLLRELLARQPENLAALTSLFTIDPTGSLAYLQDPSRNLPPNLWAQAGNALQSQGRTGEAVDAWMRAFEADPSNWEVGDALIANAPAVLWSRAEHLAASTNDDELLGDLADLNWRAGRQELAVELWRRARGIDPGDGEWLGKLRAVSLGQDPL